MEENIKSFSKGFVDNQSRIAKLENENKRLKEEVEVWKNANKILRMHDAKMEYENKKLKNSIEYRKKKADKNQEKANEINKILKIPGILKEDGKIDRPKVAFSYII